MLLNLSDELIQAIRVCADKADSYLDEFEELLNTDNWDSVKAEVAPAVEAVNGWLLSIELPHEPLKYVDKAVILDRSTVTPFPVGKVVMYDGYPWMIVDVIGDDRYGWSYVLVDSSEESPQDRPDGLSGQAWTSGAVHYHMQEENECLGFKEQNAISSLARSISLSKLFFGDKKISEIRAEYKEP